MMLLMLDVHGMPVACFPIGFLRNPTIGTFMNSPYYGTDGVPEPYRASSLHGRMGRVFSEFSPWLRFGTSGTIKENAAGLAG